MIFVRTSNVGITICQKLVKFVSTALKCLAGKTFENFWYDVIVLRGIDYFLLPVPNQRKSLFVELELLLLRMQFVDLLGD